MSLLPLPSVSNKDALIKYLRIKVENFKAGVIGKHQAEWEEITGDQEILQTVRGMKIPLTDIPQSEQPYPEFKKGMSFIDQEIHSLLKKGVVRKSEHEVGEFVSPTFITEKADGGFRFILNLKKLNQNIEKVKFKMQTLASILCMIRPNMYLAKLDIKDAYYSVPIHSSSQKLLKFKHRNELYQFTALPNGYTEGPRKFTKIMKPPLALLRRIHSVLVADYIDDLITMAIKKEKCLANIDLIVGLLDKLGFIIHPEKSIFEPSQVMEFLGFVIDTVNMVVCLTEEKKEKLRALCQEILNCEKITIRKLAKVIGKINSCFIAVEFGKLHYRALERFKIKSLRESKGKFDCLVSLPEEAKEELVWWRDNIRKSSAPISRNNPDISISTDASSTIGWGACRGSSTGGAFYG